MSQVDHKQSRVVHDLQMLPKHPVWTLIGIIVGAFAVHLILSQAGEVEEMIDSLGDAQPGWLLASVVAMAITHVGAGISLMGTVQVPLPLVQASLVQLGGAAANRLTPAGVGGMGVSVRYLQNKGVDTPTAVAAVGLDSAAGIVVHGVSLAVVALLVGQSNVIPDIRIPHGWPELAALAAVALIAGALVAFPSLRHRLASLRPMVHNFKVVLRRPLRTLQLFGGSVIITFGNIVAFYFCCLALDVDVAFLTVAAVYLAGSAIASAAPTPGGLGAVEAALVAGLSAVHVDIHQAVPAVLIFRLVTFWLPILPGWPLFHYLRRRHVL